MKNVTYLLGAGASARSLPTSESISDNLENLVKRDSELALFIDRSYSGDLRRKPEFMPPWMGGTKTGTFVAELDNLRKRSKEHPSLDTYARMLFFSSGSHESEESKQYKALIACYFLLLQVMKPVDPRYELFWASILLRDAANPTAPVIPPNVKVMTWNYDVQLEKAFRGFTRDGDHVHKTVTKSKQVLRLNGSCIPAILDAPEFLDIAYGSLNDRTLHELEHMYRRMAGIEPGEVWPGIRFAWESKSFEDYAREFVRSTQTLIVIGYSFPYFNREIDRMMLSEMKANALERVVVQAKDNPEWIKELIDMRLRESPSANVVHVETLHDVKQFFVPQEIE